jgi:hypothetical protein
MSTFLNQLTLADSSQTLLSHSALALAFAFPDSHPLYRFIPTSMFVFPCLLWSSVCVCVCVCMCASVFVPSEEGLEIFVCVKRRRNHKRANEISLTNT